jgi:hypothetical protein
LFVLQQKCSAPYVNTKASDVQKKGTGPIAVSAVLKYQDIRKKEETLRISFRVSEGR